MARRSELQPGAPMRMIFDSETAFPNSVVHYVRFGSYALRQMYAYLREKEHLFHNDIKRYKGTSKEVEVRVRLEEVEAHLIWMAHNVAPWAEKKESRQLDLL